MARKRKVHISPADMGTPELARRLTVVPKLVNPTTYAGKVIDGSEIDRLLMADAITPAQHATLGLLAKKLHGYGFYALKSPDYASRVHADATAVAEKKAESLRGAVHLIEKMDRHKDIGRYRRKKLINLVLLDAPYEEVEELQTAVFALDNLFSGRR